MVVGGESHLKLLSEVKEALSVAKSSNQKNQQKRKRRKRKKR